MTNKDKTQILLGRLHIDYVEGYVYHEHMITFKSCTEREIDRIIKNTWNKYWAMKQIVKGSLPINIIIKAMNICLAKEVER